mgnify:CR=1 FL=1
MKTNSKTNIRKDAKRRFFIESLLVIFIIISPFIYRIHEYVSTEPDATLNILGFIIDANGFQNLSVYIWFLLGKLVPLFLLLIWFFTCKHWWYHIILIPVLMYAFQIYEAIYFDNNYVDTENILWLLPVCMVIIPFVYFIRIKLYDKYVLGIDLEAIDAELEALKSDSNIKAMSDATVQEKDIENLNQESLADELDRKLSTRKIEQASKQFQLRLQNLLSFSKK